VFTVLRCSGFALRVRPSAESGMGVCERREPHHGTRLGRQDVATCRRYKHSGVPKSCEIPSFFRGVRHFQRDPVRRCSCNSVNPVRIHLISPGVYAVMCVWQNWAYSACLGVVIRVARRCRDRWGKLPFSEFAVPKASRVRNGYRCSCAGVLRPMLSPLRRGSCALSHLVRYGTRCAPPGRWTRRQENSSSMTPWHR
jgi:hypothetical protein